MAKRILVPLDRETEHEAVLPLVADIARGGGATVRMLHVAPMPDNVVNDDGLVVADADQHPVRFGEPVGRSWPRPPNSTPT